MGHMKRPVCPHFSPASPVPFRFAWAHLIPLLCSPTATAHSSSRRLSWVPPTGPPAGPGGQAEITPVLHPCRKPPPRAPPASLLVNGHPGSRPPLPFAFGQALLMARGSRPRLGREGRTSHDPESDPRRGEMEVKHPWQFWRFCGRNQFVFCLACLPAVIF